MTELMIVVAIVAVIAAIAIPKFGDLISKSQQSSAIGALGTLRSALNVYYMNTEGQHPQTLSALMPDYLAFLPSASIPVVAQYGNPGHPHNSEVEDYPLQSQIGSANDGTALWAYVSTGTDFGHVGVNCLHLDGRGLVWSEH